MPVALSHYLAWILIIYWLRALLHPGLTMMKVSGAHANQKAIIPQP
jgi:hypothetical protein